MRNNDSPRAMSVAEAAQSIGCSRALITAAVERGELPAFRLGDRVFIVRAAVERLFTSELETPSKAKGVRMK